MQAVKGFGWTWNTGGYEYPVFWAIVCLAVALEEWKSAFVRLAPGAMQATRLTVETRKAA
jgi:putative oxidoreductase